MRSISKLLLVFTLCVLAPTLSAAAASSEKPADRILVEKSARRLSLLRAGTVIKTYRVALGGQPVGPKECQGDKRTPEGKYVIDGRNKNSHFHWSLHVSYPNSADRANAKKRGCSPGGDIYIHGLLNGRSWAGMVHTDSDWTDGCIAVTNQEIEEIWGLVPNGTTVEINP
ncbi:MAG: L,D-transpeptidase family protein [Terriglobia bacterium]